MLHIFKYVNCILFFCFKLRNKLRWTYFLFRFYGVHNFFPCQFQFNLFVSNLNLGIFKRLSCLELFF